MISHTNPHAVVRTARSYIDTPFEHQGRVPGSGLDCVGVIVCACTSAGHPIHDFFAYSRESDPKEMLRQLELYFIRKPTQQIDFGNVIAFWLVHKEFPQHLGLASGEGKMIHAYGSGKVREDSITNVHSTTMNWVRHIHSVWELR